MTPEERQRIDSSIRRSVTDMLRMTPNPEDLARFILESLDYAGKYLNPNAEEFEIVSVATKETIDPFLIQRREVKKLNEK